MSPHESEPHEFEHLEYDQRQTTYQSYDHYRRRHVNEQNWDLNDLTQTNCSISSFPFDNRWPRSVMMIRFGHSFLFEFLGHPFDYLTILGVNHGGEVMFASCK